jgi:hypothetical protein
MAKYAVKSTSELANVYNPDKGKEGSNIPLAQLIVKAQSLAIEESKRYKLFQTAIEEKFFKPLAALKIQRQKCLKLVKESISKAQSQRNKEQKNVRAKLPRFYQMQYNMK